jgi:tellurite resistance protein TehA-like permease
MQRNTGLTYKIGKVLKWAAIALFALLVMWILLSTKAKAFPEPDRNVIIKVLGIFFILFGSHIIFDHWRYRKELSEQWYKINFYEIFNRDVARLIFIFAGLLIIAGGVWIAFFSPNI